MSLAQRLERPNPFNGETPSLAAFASRTAIPVDFRDITRRPQSPGAAVAPAPLPASAAPMPEQPLLAATQSDLAFDLLDEVSRALPAAMERCEQLEAALVEAQDLARSDIEAANAVAREWQQIAGALKLQVEGLEKGMKTMRQRVEGAELDAANARAAAGHSQHAAAEAECLASLFKEKVIASFGNGSAVQPLLDALRSKAVTVPT